MIGVRLHIAVRVKWDQTWSSMIVVLITTVITFMAISVPRLKPSNFIYTIRW
uniref:Uncharacterized protein n=1 Tax=Parascaris equorum TaxID=6256 RepID=A0A914RVJ3_PAREQ